MTSLPTEEWELKVQKTYGPVIVYVLPPYKSVFMADSIAVS